MYWLGMIAAMAVCGILAAAIRDFRGRRRLQAARTGEAVRVRAALSPAGRGRGFGAGWLVSEGGRTVWRSRHGRAVDLSRAQVLRSGTVSARGLQAPSGEVTLTLRTADGDPADLAIGWPDLELVSRWLSRPVEPSAVDFAPAAPPHVALLPLWARVMLGLLAVWAGGWVWFWTAGTVLDVTIVKNDDGICRVQWADPHGGKLQHANDVSCSSDARPGDPVEVLALPGLFRGEAGSTFDSVMIPIVVGVLLAAPVGIAAFRRGRTRRALGTPLIPAPVVADDLPEVPRIADDEVRFSRVVEVVTARAEVEGWAPTDPPNLPPAATPDRWWKDRRLRRMALVSGCPRLIPVAAVSLGVMTGIGPWLSAAALAGGDSSVVPGRVVRLLDDDLRVPFTGFDTRVEFTLDGRSHRAWVDADDKLEPGTAVEVLVSNSNPGRARLEGTQDAFGKDAAAGGAFVGVGLLVAGLRIRRTRIVVRSLTALRAEPARPWRYVRFVGPDGGPGLMLFSRFGDPGPEVLMPMAESQAWSALPLHGEAQVHGVPGDGVMLVAVIDGHTCWPLGEAQTVPAEVVAEFLNGSVPLIDEAPAESAGAS